MKTSVIEVHAMLSVLSVDEVERRIGEVHGVESATVNFAAGSATVRYDETRLEVGDIRSAVRQSGYEPDASATSASDDHQARSAPSATSSPHAPKAAAPSPDGAAPKSAGAPAPTPPPVVTSPTAAPPTAVAGGKEPGPTGPGKS